MKNQMNLSKTSYCKGIQCQKILWLERHKRELRDDSMLNLQILESGTRVGDLAMGYFGDYSEVPYSEDKSLMIAETKRLLKARTKIICEASFSFDGNFCGVDILRVFDGYVEFIEVKSSTEIKQIYFDDIAYQYYVLSSSGLNVTKVSIMHIDNSYERQGALDLKGLFVVRDCTEKVLSMQKDVVANIGRFREYVKEKDEPEMEIGGQCSDPYACLYYAYCWRHIPENNIFEISGQTLRFNKKLALYRRGIVSFEQLLQSGEDVSDSTRLQVESTVYKLPPAVDKEAIRAFLDTLRWPLYYLDFESFQEAIPPYTGLRPYVQVPFQFSLHIQKGPGGKTEHREFLAEEGTDPRRFIAERLCSDIPENVCILAYNMSYEKGRIRALSDFISASSPDLARHLMNIHDNFRDLMQPFRSRSYYSSELGGSYSIKQVLPALFPDDPELDYNALDLVHDGGEAQLAYAQLCVQSPEERQRTRTALLAYCRLDTLAMVKILEKLREITINL